MDARKPGALPMHQRIEHSQKNYRKMMEVSTQEVFFKMFRTLSELSQNVPSEFPVTINNFTFHSFEFLSVYSSYSPGPNQPHIASGEYKDETVHFKFQLRKTVGMKELLSFESVKTSVVTPTKVCTCSSWDLFHKGCQCGSIKPYKPVL